MADEKETEQRARIEALKEEFGDLDSSVKLRVAEVEAQLFALQLPVPIEMGGFYTWKSHKGEKALWTTMPGNKKGTEYMVRRANDTSRKYRAEFLAWMGTIDLLEHVTERLTDTLKEKKEALEKTQQYSVVSADTARDFAAHQAKARGSQPGDAVPVVTKRETSTQFVRVPKRGTSIYPEDYEDGDCEIKGCAEKHCTSQVRDRQDEWRNVCEAHAAPYTGEGLPTRIVMSALKHYVEDVPEDATTVSDWAQGLAERSAKLRKVLTPGVPKRKSTPTTEPVCAHCHKRPAVCIGSYEGLQILEYACDECCGHGNEDGYCTMLDDDDVAPRGSGIFYVNAEMHDTYPPRMKKAYVDIKETGFEVYALQHPKLRQWIVWAPGLKRGAVCKMSRHLNPKILFANANSPIELVRLVLAGEQSNCIENCTPCRDWTHYQEPSTES